MTSKTNCPQCGSVFSIPKEYLGCQARCKRCDSRFLVQESVGRQIEASKPPQGQTESAEDNIPAVWKVGDDVLGLYRVKEIHGGGNMGLVYRVHHQIWDIDLAVKTPRKEILRSQVQQDNFQRECNAWINLGLHPNIVNCHYVRKLGGIPRIFAEYIEGGDLKNWIDNRLIYEGGPAEALKRILDIAIQFAWGLQYAHEHEGQSLVHQDLKPANVMMLPDGTPKLSDFGLARVRSFANGDGADHHPLMTGSAGTPAYCSPEQYAGERLSRSTDVWSWGLCVFEMFVGERNWSSGTLAKIQLDEYLKSGTEVEGAPSMPRMVADLLAECFRDEPTSRPSNMDAVAERLIQVYVEATGEEWRTTKPVKNDLKPDGLNNRAISLLDLGKVEEAKLLFQQAIELDPHHPEAVYNYGLFRWREADDTDTDVVKAITQVRSAQPENWLPPLLECQVHLERGDVQAALESLENVSPPSHIQAEVARLKEIAKRHESTSRTRLRTLGQTISGDIKWIAACPDTGNWLLLDSAGLRLVRLGNWEVAREFTCGIGGVTAAALTHDGKVACIGSENGLIALLNLETGKICKQFVGHSSAIEQVEFSEDCKGVLSVDRGGSVIVWDVESGRPCWKKMVNVLDDGMTKDWSPVERAFFAQNGHAVLLQKADRVDLWRSRMRRKSPN